MNFKKLSAYTFLSFFLFNKSFSAESISQPPGCFDRSKIPDLHKFVGTYQTENLLNHPKVKPQLTKLMGPDLPILFNNLSVRGPVDLIGCSIVVSGIAPHRGSDENGILSIDLSSGNIHAALKSEKFKGQIIIYGNNKAWHSSGIRDWVYYTYFSEIPVKVIHSPQDYKND